MTAKVISIFDHLKGDMAEAHGAVMRALDRPLPVPPEGAKAVSREYLANWFLKGLWLEGFKVVPCDDGAENG